MKESFRDRLKSGKPIVCDGAIGTVLSNLGYPDNPRDIYNLKEPNIIQKLHEDYIAAGAEIIETNTFSANRIRLEPHHYQHLVRSINIRGAEIARKAAKGKAYVAGSVGPTGLLFEPIGKLTKELAEEVFIEQIQALLDGGVDIIMFETFIDLDELDIAIDAVHELAPDIPVIAQKTFIEDGSVLSTNFPIEVVQHIRDKGVDVVGANCTVGPQRMFSILKSMYSDDVILSAQPTAGIPHIAHGRQVYNATPKYLAEYAVELVKSGVTIVGACCGSTPDHTKAMADAVKNLTVGKPEKSSVIITETEKTEEPNKADEHSEFHKKLQRGEMVLTCELDIPRGYDMSSVIEGAEILKSLGIDLANITDGARARLRMSPVAITTLVKQKTGLDSMMHLACRDRNLLGLQSELLGAYALGQRNVLAITGDPANIGDYPHATSVYDVDSVGLIRAVKSMTLGQDLLKNSLGKPLHFHVSCAVNPASDEFDLEMQKLERKIEAGAMSVFTQPLFEMSVLEKFLRRIEGFKIPVILGILPLRGVKHASFLHHEVPGIDVPEHIMKKLENAPKGSGAAVGTQMAVEFLHEAKKHVQGVYLMPPFQKYEVISEILGTVGLLKTEV